MKTFYSLTIIGLILLGCDKQNSKSQKELLPEKSRDSIIYRKSRIGDHPQPSVIRVYEKLNFGNGYNSTTGQEYFGVLEFEGMDLSSEILANARGNRGQVTMDILENKEELKNSLNISTKADLKFKLGAWSSDNSLKLETLQTTEFNNFSQHAILKASYVNEPLVLINPRIKEELIELAKRDPETFIRTCGDMFVSRIYTGGEMYTLFSLNSRDTNEKVKNDLFFKTTNEYLGNTLDVTVQAQAMNSSVSKVKNINTVVITEGGFKTPESTDMEAYIKYANAFKEQVSADNRAVILYVELSPYESIAGFPDIDFSIIRVKQRGVLDAASDALYMIEEDYANAKFVQKHSELFEPEDVDSSVVVEQKYYEHLNRLQKIIADCSADPNYCYLSDLEIFENYETFNPEFDLPEWKGTPTKLPLDPNSGWIIVSEDTEDGKILSINGEFQVRLSTTDNDPECRSASYQFDRIPFGKQYTHTTGALWWKEKHYRDIKKLYYYPHYQVRYTSLETGNIIKEFNWTAPLETEPNVKVEVRYRNPDAILQYWDGKRYRNIGMEAEKKLNYKTRVPQYPVVQSCEAAKPLTAIIAAKNSSPDNDTYTSLKSVNADNVKVELEKPKMKKNEDGLYTFIYDW